MSSRKWTTEASCARGVPFWRMFSVHAVLDEDQRPLGEHRAPAGLEGAAPTQLKECPYAGSRYRHALPMNANALRQMAQHWNDIAAGIAFLHDAFREPRSELTLPQLWRLLAAAAVLPSYLLHRTQPAVGPSPLKAFVAAIYKASLGIKYMLEQQLVQDVLAGRPVHRPADAERLSALSESSGVLVGLEQVCAAPANMIADTMRAFVRGGEPGAAARSALAGILGPLEPFRAFTRAACDLYSALLAFSTLGARLQSDLESVLAVPVPASQSRESGPLIQGLSVEVSMSLTIGMRRICWPFARLGEARCGEMLKAFCEIVSGEEGPRNVAALRAALDSADAARSRAILAQQLESELAPQVAERRVRESLGHACDLLAAYCHLESAVWTALRQAERRLNEVLGRDHAAGETASVLAGYCAVSVWNTASQGLGVRLASEPESGTVRCGEGRVRAMRACVAEPMGG